VIYGVACRAASPANSELVKHAELGKTSSEGEAVTASLKVRMSASDY